MTDSARKQELLEAAYQYVLGNGLADMSLRPLAKEIGSSPRVLLFLFGSKEELIRALLARARDDELRYLAELRRERGGLAATGRDVWAWLADPAHRALLALWVEGYARSLLGEPGPWADFGRDTVRDWLDLLAGRQDGSAPSGPANSYDPAGSRDPIGLGDPASSCDSAGLGDPAGSCDPAGPDDPAGSSELVGPGERADPGASPSSGSGAEAERTLLLAVLRGALLDLLATGDTDRVTRAVNRHLDTIDRSAGTIAG